MRRPCLKPFALAVTAWMAGSIGMVLPDANLWAQQLGTPNQSELDEAIRESAKPERIIPTPGSLMIKPPKKDEAREFAANKIDGIERKNATAEGNVSLKQDTMEVRTKHLDYDQQTDTATTIARQITVKVYAGSRRGSGTLIAKRGH